MKRTYIFMRFNNDGSLVTYEIVTCKETDFFDCLSKFEQDCIDGNIGETIGFMDTKEFDRITNDI